MQLRNFGPDAGADNGVLAADEFAFFSESKAEGPAIALALALALSGDILKYSQVMGIGILAD